MPKVRSIPALNGAQSGRLLHFRWFSFKTSEKRRDSVCRGIAPYNPDYESFYSGIEITPDVLHVLRTSDRKMRYMEHQLKTERFVEDQEQRVAKFLPSRETSLDEMIEKEHRQFAAEQRLGG